MRDARAPTPTSMTLATATADGRPSVRIVLLKAPTRAGSSSTPTTRAARRRNWPRTGRASLLFYWQPLERQVRIDGLGREGRATPNRTPTSPAVRSRAAGASTPRSRARHRPGAERSSRASRRRGDHGANVPRPSWWGGYRVVPDEFEFWQGRPSRLARPAALPERRVRVDPGESGAVDGEACCGKGGRHRCAISSQRR